MYYMDDSEIREWYDGLSESEKKEADKILKNKPKTETIDRYIVNIDTDDYDHASQELFSYENMVNDAPDYTNYYDMAVDLMARLALGDNYGGRDEDEEIAQTKEFQEVALKLLTSMAQNVNPEWRVVRNININKLDKFYKLHAKSREPAKRLYRFIQSNPDITQAQLVATGKFGTKQAISKKLKQLRRIKAVQNTSNKIPYTYKVTAS